MSARNSSLSAPLVRALAAAMFAVFLFTGCAVLNPGPPPARMQLIPGEQARSTMPSIPKQLVVERPTSTADLDSDSIALFFNGREVRYLAGYRWADSVPSMFRRSLIDGLLANGSLLGVSNESAGISADARLLSDIRQFHLRYDDEKQPPAAEINVTMQLINLRDGTVMASTSFTSTQKAAGTNHTELIKAFEATLTQVLAEAVPWVEGEMRKLGAQ